MKSYNEFRKVVGWVAYPDVPVKSNNNLVTGRQLTLGLYNKLHRSNAFNDDKAFSDNANSHSNSAEMVSTSGRYTTFDDANKPPLGCQAIRHDVDYKSTRDHSIVMTSCNNFGLNSHLANANTHTFDIDFFGMPRVVTLPTGLINSYLLYDMFKVIYGLKTDYRLLLNGISYKDLLLVKLHESLCIKLLPLGLGGGGAKWVMIEEDDPLVTNKSPSTDRFLFVRGYKNELLRIEFNKDSFVGSELYDKVSALFYSTYNIRLEYYNITTDPGGNKIQNDPISQYKFQDGDIFNTILIIIGGNKKNKKTIATNKNKQTKSIKTTTPSAKMVANIASKIVSNTSTAMRKTPIQKTSTKMTTNKLPNMSPCALKLLTAIKNPWDPRAFGACLPSNPARDSQKCCGFVRGTGAIGSGGLGFVIVYPSIANNSVQICYTTSNYPGTNVLPFNTGLFSTGVLSAFCPNLPFTDSQLYNQQMGVTGAQGRIAAVGLKAWYTGTKLNMSGNTYCFVSPTHEDLTGATLGDLGARAECEIKAVDGSVCTLSSTSISPEETTYDRIANQAGVEAFDAQGSIGNQMDGVCEVIHPWSGGKLCLGLASIHPGPRVGGGCMVWCITGVAGSTFAYEYIIHNEYVGVLTEGRATESVSDVVGLTAVQNATQKAHGIAASGKMWGKALLEGLQITAKEVLPVAASAIVSALI